MNLENEVWYLFVIYYLNFVVCSLLPYAILTCSLPTKKMGVYMGLFNFFIVIPQITAAAILDFFVKNLFGNEAIYALLLGGASMIIGGILVLFVDDADE